jgi:hypothetical protein
MRDHLGAARSETVTARASAASASAQHREAIALLESDARTAREWRAKADVSLTQFPREREALQAQVSALCCRGCVLCEVALASENDDRSLA